MRVCKLLGLLVILFVLAGCSSEEMQSDNHQHVWIEASCTMPKTCSECQATEGEAINHSWEAVDGTVTCSVCDKTRGTDDVVSYPLKVVFTNYNGPECWLFSESNSLASENILEIFAVIDTQKSNWRDQTKMVISAFKDVYGDEEVMLKIYNDTEGLNKKQPTYEALIAVWESDPFSMLSESVPTIIWYPNGAGVAAEQELEKWTP